MKATISMAVLITLLGIASCTSTLDRNMASGARLGNFLDFRTLSRKDYTVLKSVEGKAQVSYSRFLIIPTYSVGVFDVQMKSGSIGREGDLREEYGVFDFPGGFSPVSPESLAKNEAVFHALAKIPDADLLLQPRYSWRCVSSQFFVYSSEVCTVTVRGKAIRINEG